MSWSLWPLQRRTKPSPSLPLVLVLLLLVAVPVAAQTGTITGTITNSATGLPIAGVSVGVFTLDVANVGNASTNASGVYTVSGVPPGALYFVVVFGESSGSFVGEAYPDSKCQGQCSTAIFNNAIGVSVAAGATVSGIDVALDPASRISGTVTNAAGGAPISGATVAVYQRLATGTVLVGSAGTNSAGLYSVGSLPAGTYYLAINNAGGFRREVYDNLPCVGSCSSAAILEGTPVVVGAGATVSGRDFALDAGGQITGTITDAVTGAPLQNVSVVAYTRVAGVVTSVASSITNAAGQYTLTGLASATYGLLTSVPSNLNYANEIYNDIACPLTCSTTVAVDSGTPVPVTLGATTSGINFGLTPGGSISGTVTNESTGLPLASVTVTAVVVHSGQTFTRAGVTNASGVYTIVGLPAGSFALFTNTSGFTNEIYNNIPCPGAGVCTATTAFLTGTLVAVTSGGTTSGRDFALQPRTVGGIAGLVTDAATGLPISGVTVELWSATGGSITFVGTATTNVSGAYSRTDLSPGSYRADTSGAIGTHRFRNEVFDDIGCLSNLCPVPTIAAGTPIAVTAGATATANFGLARVEGLSGTITDAASGQPLAGVTVNVYQRPSGQFAGSAATNYLGRYSVFGLPNGTYVALTSNALGHFNEIYDNIRCTTTCSSATAVASGTAITVTGGAAFTDEGALVTGINFALDVRDQAPAAPSGLRIVTSGGTAQFTWTAPSLAAGGAPTSYLLEAGGSPGTTFITLPIPGTGTSFSVPGVPPGAYYVRIRAVNAFGTGPASNEVLLVVGAGGTGVPDPPTNLLAFVSNGLLTMSWSAAFGGGPASDYIVEAGTASGLSNIAAIAVGRTLFTYSPVPNGFYFLRVRARNAGGISLPSTEILLNVGNVPAPPNAPNFTSASVSGSTVTLAWAAPVGGTAATSYVVEAGSATGLSNLAVANVGNVLTQSFAGVPPGTYYIRIRAVNALGASLVSNERVITVS